MSLTRPDYKIIGNLLLQDMPRCLHIFRGVTPIPLCLQISEVQELIPARNDGGDASCDLPGDECFPSTRALMVKQDAISSK